MTKLSQALDALARVQRERAKLLEANVAAVARAAELTVANEALKNKVEWFKARCAELEALRPAVSK